MGDPAILPLLVLCIYSDETTPLPIAEPLLRTKPKGHSSNVWPWCLLRGWINLFSSGGPCEFLHFCSYLPAE